MMFFGKALVCSLETALREPVEPILGRLQGDRDTVGIAQQKPGHVDQRAAVGLGADRETPQHRLGEPLLYRQALEDVVAVCPVPQVRLQHQDLGADALEPHQNIAAALPPIEPDVVGAHAGRQPADVQHVLVEPVDLHVERARGGIPIEWEQAVELLHRGDRRLDRGRRVGSGGGAGLLGDGERWGADERGKQESGASGAEPSTFDHGEPPAK